MQEVAIHLRDHACALVTPEHIDSFGRSAFNRFYYACYWEVRTAFPDIHKNWLKLGHKDLPEYLTSSTKVEMLKQLNRLYKNKLIQHTEYSKLAARINYALNEISRLLVKGYSIRCIADYSPEIKVINKGGGLILGSQKISSIEHLYSEVRRNVGILKDCRNDLI